jgi:excisionase family DNA binding protein
MLAVQTVPDTPTLPQLAVTLDAATIDALALAVARRVFESMPDPAADVWINAREAAEHLGIHYSTLKERTAAGELPAYQDTPGGALWFKRSELDEQRGERCVR